MLIFVAFQVLVLTSTNTNANVNRHPLVHRNKKAAAAYQVADSKTGVQEAITDTEYLVTIGVGPTNQTLVIDTGSDLIWVQCTPCDKCFDSSPDGILDPSKSTTIQWVPCANDASDPEDPNALICYKLDKSERRCSDVDNRCGFDYSYGDGSYTRGTLVVESLATSSSLVANVAMGCGHDNNAVSFAGEADGVLGLGWGSLSLPSQSTGGAFSYCLGREKDSFGWLEFGRSSFPREAEWARLAKNTKRPSLYYVELSGLEVGGEAVDMPEDTLKGFDLDSGEGGTIIDSGTTFTLLVEAAYVALRDKFKSKMEGLLSPADLNYPTFDTCYDVTGVDITKVALPVVSFVFSGSVTGSENIKVNASNVLLEVSGNRACFAFGSMGTSVNIIGNKQQEGFQISFDASGGYVSFVPSVC